MQTDSGSMQNQVFELNLMIRRDLLGTLSGVSYLSPQIDHQSLKWCNGFMAVLCCNWQQVLLRNIRVDNQMIYND